MEGGSFVCLVDHLSTSSSRRAEDVIGGAGPATNSALQISTPLHSIPLKKPTTHMPAHKSQSGQQTPSRLSPVNLSLNSAIFCKRKTGFARRKYFSQVYLGAVVRVLVGKFG